MNLKGSFPDLEIPGRRTKRASSFVCLSVGQTFQSLPPLLIPDGRLTTHPREKAEMLHRVFEVRQLKMFSLILVILNLFVSLERRERRIYIYAFSEP